ncbi:MAG TPA: hypothetical protein EYQ00_08330 [Dehalococcoidia bacterium]|nr:hypothetical protein [Dehalococcoidia bacterium]
MKDRFFTIAMMSTLLGVYSASVYHFSLDNIHDDLHNDHARRMLPEVEVNSEDLHKILEAVRIQTQETDPVITNLPVPGAECSVSLNDILTDSTQEFDEEISRCLRSSYASGIRE